MPRTRLLKALLWIAATLAGTLLAVTAGVKGVDHLESGRNFCNACHLPDGTPLHAGKLRIALERPRLDLTGVHFRDALQGRFACADCHRGAGWQERTHVLWGAAVNTLRYLAGSFREPERLARPILNVACTGCHGEPTRQGDPARFHGSLAHLAQHNVPCTDCHRGHTAATEPAPASLALRQAAQRVCARCHQGDPPAPHVSATLDAYRATLRARMEGHGGA
jgi:predicted CXXCH cytochrome family protein